MSLVGTRPPTFDEWEKYERKRSIGGTLVDLPIFLDN